MAPGSVSRAARSGEVLLAVRAELCRRLDNPNLEDRDVASLARELRILQREIDSAGSGEVGDRVDELSERRRARRSG